MVTSYIALGSNLNQPVKQLLSAIANLRAHPKCNLKKVSPFYQNPAVGPVQPDFINAVVECETHLEPLALLQLLQQIELIHGRVRSGVLNEPRTLDLDIILYGQQVIEQGDLMIPHPRFYQRAFVLVPLYDIAPDLVLPNGKLLKEYYEKRDKNASLNLLCTASISSQFSTAPQQK